MIAPLVIFPVCGETCVFRPADIVFVGVCDFNKTEVEVVAKTDAGRAFLADLVGAGAVSLTIRKSASEVFALNASKAGIRWEGK